MENVTAIIKSFLRNQKTTKCVDTLLEFYPGVKIIVVEDGYHQDRMKDYYNNLEAKGHKVIYTPFDIGISQGRNLALENIQTKYALIGDNDFIYHKDAGVDRMKKILDERDDIDIVCGGITEDGKKLYYEGHMDIKNDGRDNYLKYTELNLNTCKWEQVGNERIVHMDIGFNYFLMRTSIYPKTFWCPNIKVSCEHSDFFMRCKKNGVRVVYLENAFAINDITKDGVHEDYTKFRGRRSDCQTFGKNWEVVYGIDFGGGRMDYDTP